MTDEKERVALLPCPFCGGEAVTTMAWQIRCDNKDCALCFYTMSERQWNTRAQKQQVSGDDLLEVMHEAKREVESWKPWQRAAAGYPDKQVSGDVVEAVAKHSLLKIILDDITEAQRITDNAIMRHRAYPEERIEAYTLVDIANIIDEIPKKIAAMPQPVEMGEEECVDIIAGLYADATMKGKGVSPRAVYRALQAKARIVMRDV